MYAQWEETDTCLENELHQVEDGNFQNTRNSTEKLQDCFGTMKKMRKTGQKPWDTEMLTGEESCWIKISTTNVAHLPLPTVV